jgi:hypothetical protein
MAFELGTKTYSDYTKNLTPGQGDTDQADLDEKAVSQQQQKLMGLAYAVKKGEIDSPSPEVQKIADSMSLEELKKMAEGKHKDLPVKVAIYPFSSSPSPGFQLDVGTPVAMKDKGKLLYGKVEELEKVQGKPGVVVRWSNSKSGRFQMSAFAGLKMDKKADYIVSEDVDKEVEEKLDGRRKIFREKIKKLAYEKAKKLLAKKEVEESQKTEKEEKERVKEVKNKVKINPEVAEERRGYKTLKKYHDLRESNTMSKLEEDIVTYLKEGAFKAHSVAGEHGHDVLGAASVMSIARAFQVNPMHVAQVLEKMVRAGTINREGDAYTYGSTEIANG